MIQHYSDHYSHNFILNIKKLPARATDRFSRLILIVATVFGLLLLLLGIYSFYNFTLNGVVDIEKGLPQAKVYTDRLVSPLIFNWVIMLTGIGVIVGSIIQFVRYRKILFDGDTVTVKGRLFLGGKYAFSEPLYNYVGVRLRVKFYQFGVINKNKFIVELYHKDPSKIVPLYISTSKSKIRTIWKNYAQALHMPAITMSEKGMVSRNFNDLSRPYKEVVAEWHLPQSFLLNQPKPTYVSYKKKSSGEAMLKIRKLFVDAYSILSGFVIFVLGGLLIYAGINNDVLLSHLPQSLVVVFYTTLLAIIIYTALSLVSKDIVLITKDSLLVFRKIGVVRIRDSMIKIRDIKAIDINYIPTLDRYYLAVSTDKTAALIGHKLPPEDLRWIRAMLISEIIGN